ncbi:helix-turn-helix transcriptional regulator [Leisingera sp. XS_AS12]|jgi:predicted DNA-binding transcriptional regulator AlpA|uniref:helix-turn-helix transcriptional regulator n=1 Tax=unclassified Leisingera TaxID=2614906 RepID=UPI001C979F31|nr:hypothetical protein [Nocardioides marinus]
MATIQPAALREANAAAFLDLSVTKFRSLVKHGALPGPVRLADGVERWRADDLRAILSGTAARPSEDFEL